MNKIWTTLLKPRAWVAKLLLVIFIVAFFSLGFLTGLLGINIGGIPGADNGGAFFIFCGILICIVALQVFLFKRMKWF